MDRKDKIRILHIAECAGGVERYLAMLLPRLEPDFYQELLCSPRFHKETFEQSVDYVRQIPLSQTFSPVQIWKEISLLREYIKASQPDIVYCHSSFAGALGRMAAIGLPCKTVYNPHGWAFNMRQNRLKRSVYLLIERLLAKRTDAIVCISRAEWQSAVQYRIGKEEQYRLIPSGIDVEAVMKATPISRETIGLADDDFVIGAIGRLVPQKSPDVFVKAAELIQKEIPNAAFVFLGDGEQMEEIWTFAQTRHIKLVMPGWVNNPYAYLRIFDVAMSLPRWEGFGLAIAEYMAARKSIIATRVDAIPTLIEDGKEGLLVPVDSPEEVKEKVVFLYNHPQEAERLSTNAYEKVCRDLRIERVAEQHGQVFNEIVKL